MRATEDISLTQKNRTTENASIVHLLRPRRVGVDVGGVFRLLEGHPEQRCDYPNAIEGVVRQDFPAVYYAVRWLSRDSHGETIRHLQRREAELVVERACVNVPDGVPVTPIFDCLVGRVQDQKLLEDALDKAGRETGIPVKYKAKHWS